MPVLVLDYQAMYVAEKYADFLSTLTWYRMYCLARFGKSKSDYMKGFESLKDKYEFFFEFSEYDEPSWMRPSLQLIDDVEKILRTRNFSDREIGQIASIIKDFEDNREQKFRDLYFKYGIYQAAKSLYSEKLYKSVKDLLENDNYPEAVLASFKYLDMHLQTILKLSPHEYYGEELINAAFSPNSGALQLKDDTK